LQIQKDGIPASIINSSRAQAPPIIGRNRN